MSDWFRDVLDFHRQFAPHLIGTCPAVPTDHAIVDMRRALVAEEYGELDWALKQGDLTRSADGVADLIYVLLGLCVTYGIDLRPVWDAVHRANMAKVGGGTRADGKVLKPAGWEPPDVASILSGQQGSSSPMGSSDPVQPTEDERSLLLNYGVHVAMAEYRARTGCDLLTALEVFMDLPCLPGSSKCCDSF